MEQLRLPLPGPVGPASGGMRHQRSPEGGSGLCAAGLVAQVGAPRLPSIGDGGAPIRDSGSLRRSVAGRHRLFSSRGRSGGRWRRRRRGAPRRSLGLLCCCRSRTSRNRSGADDPAWESMERCLSIRSTPCWIRTLAMLLTVRDSSSARAESRWQRFSGSTTWIRGDLGRPLEEV